MNNILPILLVVGAGASVALQQVLNANLRGQLASPWWAGFISYLVGTIVTLAVALAVPGPRLSLHSLRNGSGNWMAWTGGVFGSIFIAISILMVPRLGAAAVLALIVVGQMIASMAFDHFGLLGTPQHAISAARLLGAGLLVAGVVLIRWF